MTEIIKGGNLPVPGQVWRIEVVRRPAGGGVPDVETSAWLLDASGQAGGDGDPVFERVAEKDGLAVDRLEIDPARVGPDVRRILIVAATADGTFGQVPGLSVRTLGAASGEPLARYEIDDATTETALVLGEFYRRDGGWRFRAVGEGYDSGLAGLSEDFGIDAKRALAPAPAPAPVGPVPLDLPRGAVGKSSGPAPAADHGQEPGTGTGLAKTPGSEARSGPEYGVPEYDLSRPPSRVDLSAEGRWSSLIVPSPTPSPEAASAAGSLGGEFADIVYTGRGKAKFAMDEKPPAGYVLVDFARTGSGYFALHSIDWDGREAVSFGSTATPRAFERRAMWCDNLYPLRFRVTCDDHDEWVIVIRPVSAVRELGEAATGRGSEVLLHTGPAGELVTRLSPTKEASPCGSRAIDRAAPVPPPGTRSRWRASTAGA